MNNDNLKKCPNCNSYVDCNDKFCKVCGHDFSKDENYSSEGKTFEDFLLEATKSRSNNKNNNKNERKENDKVQQVKSDKNKDDTTDRLNIVDMQNISLDEERKKAFEESDEEIFNNYDYYYEDHKKNKLVKKIVMAVIAAAAVVGIIFGVKYIKPSFQQNLAEKTVTAESVKGKFMDSISKKSATEMIRLAKSSNTSVVFNEKQANEFIEELSTNEEYKTNINKWLDDDVSNLKSDKSYKSNNPIKLVKNGDGYRILIDPIKLDIKNPENAKLSIEDSSEYTFPGKKILKVESNDLIVRQNIELNYSTQNNVIDWDSVDLKNTIADYKIESGDKNYEVRKTTDRDCLVFINDKNTSMMTDEFSNFGKKNLVEDKDTVFIVAKGEDGLLKSPTETIGWETWIRLYLSE